MYRRNMLLVAFGLSILPMPHSVIAAPYDQQIASMTNGAGGGVSDPLFRARWSLPSNGVIPKLESPQESAPADSGNSLATPAELAAQAQSKARSTARTTGPSQSTADKSAVRPASSGLPSYSTLPPSSATTTTTTTTRTTTAAPLTGTAPLSQQSGGLASQLTASKAQAVSPARMVSSTRSTPASSNSQPPIVRLILEPNATDQNSAGAKGMARPETSMSAQTAAASSQMNNMRLDRLDATNLLRPAMPEAPAEQARTATPENAAVSAPVTQLPLTTAVPATVIPATNNAVPMTSTAGPGAITVVPSTSDSVSGPANPPLQTTISPSTDLVESKATESSNAPENSKIIEAGVSVWDSANISRIVEHLVDLNFANSKQAQDLDKKVQHFSSKTSRALAGAKDALNQSFVYEGTDPSQRMGKLVLNDEAKVRDHVTAEYERQKYVDKIHSQIISSLSQIATGLGTADSVRKAQIIDSGVKSLSNLVGAEQADKALISLTSWLSSAKVPETVFDKPAWDTMERDSKLETILRGAFEKDAVISEVRKRVNRYANPGKLKSGTSRTVETTLTMASWLAPGWTIPIAAEAALDGFIAATGGTEESKIEKELIYDKRIQSRLKVLSTEASLALDNYRFALVTKNPPLLTFSEALIADMANDKIADEVLGDQVDANKQLAQRSIPEIKESKDPATTRGSKVKKIVRTLKEL